MRTLATTIAFTALCFLGLNQSIRAQSSAFTYQGKLTDTGTAANGPYDLTFKLFDLASGGTQIGADALVNDAQVTAGIFTVNLDFGTTPFTSTTGNYLEISVRPGASTGAYTLLVPRQPLTSSPYAVQTIRAGSAVVADNAAQLGGIPANQFVRTGDTRLADDRNPTAGSTNYIQNIPGIGQQSASFNITGGGSANVFNAATQFNIGGNRILGSPGGGNVFAGRTAGLNNAGAIFNSYFGDRSGEANIGGSSNSFFGERSGLNSQGINNSFFGAVAGQSNTTGGNNTVIGTLADVGAPSLNFATALGAGAVVSTSNTVVLGRVSDAVQIPGALNVAGSTSFSGTLGANIFNATTQFNIGGNRVLSVEGTDNFFAGVGSGQQNTGLANTFVGLIAGSHNTTGNGNSFVGWRAGSSISGDGNTTGFSNSFFGAGAGRLNTTGSNNTAVGSGADFSSPALDFATAIGAGAIGSASNTVVIGRSVDSVQIPGALNVTGSTSFGGTLGANIFNATTQFNIGGNRVLSAAGTDNLFVGVASGQQNTGLANTFVGLIAGGHNTTGNGNSFFGWRSGSDISSNGNTTGSSNSFFGGGSGLSNTSGSSNTLLGFGANVGSGNLSNATAIGANSMVSQNNSLVLGSNANVGIGTSVPEQKLHVDGTTEILSTGTGAGFKFRDRGSSLTTDDWVWYSNGNIARFFRAGVGDLLTVQLNPNVFQTKYHFTGQVQVTTLFASGNASPLIISSPNQVCWAITINNSGQLGTNTVPCPL